MANDNKHSGWERAVELALEARFFDLAWSILVLVACSAGLNLTSDLPADETLTGVVRWSMGAAIGVSCAIMIGGGMRLFSQSFRGRAIARKSDPSGKRKLK